MKSSCIERLTKLGPSSLTDDELALVAFDQPCNCTQAERNALVQGSRLGVPTQVSFERWASLLAWHHLKLRWLGQDVSRQALTHPGQVKEYLQHRLGGLGQEQVLALFLDSSLHLVECRVLSIGTINEARVYPRELVRGVIESGATSVILAHNHPSGQLRASASDIALTDRLTQVLKGLDVELVDHFVVTAQGICSIKAQNKAA